MIGWNGRLSRLSGVDSKEKPGVSWDPGSSPPRMKAPKSFLRRSGRAKFIPALEVALGLTLSLCFPRSFRSDNFVFYSPAERRVVPLEMVDNAPYLPLLGVLNAAGKVNGIQEKPRSLAIWFGGIQLQLKADDKKVKLAKNTRALSRPVRVVNGQWLVPVDFLSSVLPDLIHEPVRYQLEGRRAFIGDIKALSYAARLEATPDGARVTLQFTAPVTVRTASQNGAWVLYLGNAAVQPPNAAVRFQNPYLSELRFDDQDGRPKVILTPSVEGLNFYPGPSGPTTFVAEIRKPPPVAQEQPRPAQQAPAAAAPAPQAPPLPVVVLDAGHGGSDIGARSRDGVEEKDLVAALESRVRAGLSATNKYRVIETRSGDADPDFDQRAAVANGAHAAAFLSFHAGDLGSAVPRLAVYTYVPLSHNLVLAAQSGEALPAPNLPGGKVPFPLWTGVQQDQLSRSRQLAQALALQFGELRGVAAGEPLEAPVRILRSVDAPAAAIELGSLASDVDAQALNNPAFQQAVASAIVHALEAFLGG